MKTKKIWDKNSREYKEFRRKANERNKKYYSKPEVKERRKVYTKKYRSDNKEKISKYGKRLRATPEYQTRVKKWREDNKEHLRKYKQTPEYKIKKRQLDKKYYHRKRKDKDYVNSERERLKKFREDNPEKVGNYNKKYYKSPKGIVSYTNHNHRRLALINNSPTDMTNEKVKRIFNRDKVCVYCRSNINLELDHIIPLVKGGTCMFNNFVLACGKCNRSKSARDVFYWCKLQSIKVPQIVLDCLRKQKNEDLNSNSY